MVPSWSGPATHEKELTCTQYRQTCETFTQACDHLASIKRARVI